MDANAYTQIELKKVAQECQRAQSQIRIGRSLGDVVRAARVHVPSWLRPLARPHLSSVQQSAERKLDLLMTDYRREIERLQGDDRKKAIETVAREIDVLRGYFPYHYQKFERDISQMKLDFSRASEQAAPQDVAAAVEEGTDLHAQDRPRVS